MGGVRTHRTRGDTIILSCRHSVIIPIGQGPTTIDQYQYPLRKMESTIIIVKIFFKRNVKYKIK